jgi:hypothetical protein
LLGLTWVGLAVASQWRGRNELRELESGFVDLSQKSPVLILSGLLLRGNGWYRTGVSVGRWKIQWEEPCLTVGCEDWRIVSPVQSLLLDMGYK